MNTTQGNDTSEFYENRACSFLHLSTCCEFKFNLILMALQTLFLKLPELQFGRSPCVPQEENHILTTPQGERKCPKPLHQSI